MRHLKWTLWAAALAALPAQLLAQEGVGDVVYVPTPQIVVEEMLRMAKVGPKDFVIDLGSGDGRMVITAAKTFGARGFGVDLDPVLLKLSNESAQREGVADRARFIEQNLFETDLSQATVITSYLLPEMNLRLRPSILNLKPGTRVVAHDYHMDEWEPDEQRTLTVPEKTVGTPGVSYVYLWIVPARVAGRWQSQIKGGNHPSNLEFDFEQHFQRLDGFARSGNQKFRLRGTKIKGDRISFMFWAKERDNSTRHEFSGTVKRDAIEGTFRLGEGARIPWNAKLVQRAEMTKPFQSSMVSQ